jgi:SAM-dependent methyltransferase
MPRFILLEHIAAPDDPAGLHYDLLLEQTEHCRTWRLAAMPGLDGPEVNAVEVAPHRLAWLDHEAGPVSGGRGFARRIDVGFYEPTAMRWSEVSPPSVVTVTLHGERTAGTLHLRPDGDRWRARLLSPIAPAARHPASATTVRDARDDWRRFVPSAIPTKDSTPRLDAFLDAAAAAGQGRPLAVLDVGCGSGRLSRRLFERGFSVVGVDINPEAIRAAHDLAVPPDASGRGLQFAVADFATADPPRLDGGPFDLVVCQLVISIIGDARHRANLLRHAHDCLRPGGRLFLSASGVSDTINAGYARLYADDVHLTGEQHSYLSRNDRGEVLYMTHHFTEDELTSLLEAAGFDEIAVTTERETSSRRPDEAAFFHYVTCRKRP